MDFESHVAVGQVLQAKAACDVFVCEPPIHHIGKLFEIVKERPIGVVNQRRGTMGSLCQSALAAFLFSPAGLLALVAIIRHSERVTTAFIATMAIRTSLLICNRTHARTLGLKARKRARVRCSSLVDWPVYPRLAHTMRASNGAQSGADTALPQ